MLPLPGLSLPLLGLSLLLSIALCVHVVRTGREMYWLWIILMFQPLGGLVYFLAIVLPEVFRGPAARRIGEGAREALDPTREYREAKAQCEDSPTVRNRLRLAHAAAALGRHAEAETLYRESLHGVYADDPALLLGRANALLELGRPSEALEMLEQLGRDEANGRTPPAALALGRAYEALGRTAEADQALEWAAGRLPGFEGIARYAAFMARNGRAAEARETLAEIDRRMVRLQPAFRKEARAWRDLAARALAAA
jgi:hypothetical protein